jgi:hypothetical protein
VRNFSSFPPRSDVIDDSEPESGSGDGREDDDEDDSGSGKSFESAFVGCVTDEFRSLLQASIQVSTSPTKTSNHQCLHTSIVTTRDGQSQKFTTESTLITRPTIPTSPSRRATPDRSPRRGKRGKRSDSSSPTSCRLLWPGLADPSVAPLLICCDFFLKFDEKEKIFIL